MTRHRWILGSLLCMVLLLLAVSLSVGSVDIPLAQVARILFQDDRSVRTWHYIIWESRLPQCLVACLAGAGLAGCGLMMQTVFNNPLADPSILGISAGAALGAALVLLLGAGTMSLAVYSLSGFVGLLIGALLGALAVLSIILFLSSIIKDGVLLLIAGIMIGYLSSSIISILNYFSSVEGVHSFMVWGMGTFGNVSLQQLPYFLIITVLGICIVLLLIKPLNALLLGDNYAENLGVSVRKVRWQLLLATGLLTATITAFCGPIAFIGLSVPHIARMLLRTANHRLLLPATLLTGAVVALLCNLITLLPTTAGTMPLNAVTALIGAPVILFVIIKRHKQSYFR